MGIRASARVVLGAAVSFGMLAMVPGVALAASPACGDTITSNTTLSADMDCSGYAGDALSFGANKITLNLNGHTITGPAGYDGYSGIDTDGYKKGTITNGTIANYTYGVDLDSSNRMTVSKLTISGENDGSDSGIYLYGGVSNVINKVTVTGVEDGLYLEDGASTQVTNNTVSATDDGLYAEYETADTISNNKFTADNAVYDDYSQRQTYSNNTAVGTTYGFYLDCDGYGKVTLSGNTANNTTSYGFYVYECYDDANYAGGPGTGSQITGNTANNGDYGFYDYYGYNEVWKNNTANDNSGYGFYFEYSASAKATGNTALRNDEGFYLEENYSYENFYDFSSNTAKKNTDYGFYAEYGTPGSGNVAKKNGTNCYNVDCN